MPNFHFTDLGGRKSFLRGVSEEEAIAIKNGQIEGAALIGYVILAWGNVDATLQDALERFQRRAARKAEDSGVPTAEPLASLLRQKAHINFRPRLGQWADIARALIAVGHPMQKDVLRVQSTLNRLAGLRHDIVHAATLMVPPRSDEKETTITCRQVKQKYACGYGQQADPWSRSYTFSDITRYLDKMNSVYLVFIGISAMAADALLDPPSTRQLDAQV